MNKINILFLTTEPKDLDASTLHFPNFFERGFDYKNVTDDLSACKELKNNFYQVIVSEGSEINIAERFPSIYYGPSSVRRKWLHYDSIYSPEEVGRDVFECHSNYTFTKSKTCSIVTPLYHTNKEYFIRAYESLKKQTYTDWEWILVDDSIDKSKTEYVKSLTEYDFRVKYYDFQHIGNIGEVKRKGFLLAKGEYLFELDHDDELLEDCLEKVVNTFDLYTDVGFVYSDCYQPHINKYGKITGSTNYGEGWGMDYGENGILEDFRSSKVYRIVTPNQNCKTVRYITAMPNHVRVWRKDVYYSIGGHNGELFIADDYEIMVRTFLKTRMARIPKALYVQYYYDGEETNSQSTRLPEIQRTTWMASRHYDKHIHYRLLSLGLEDYVWNETLQSSENIFETKPKRSEHCTIIVDLDKI